MWLELNGLDPHTQEASDKTIAVNTDAIAMIARLFRKPRNLEEAMTMGEASMIGCGSRLLLIGGTAVDVACVLDVFREFFGESIHIK